MTYFRRNKYNAKRTYYNGSYYDSKLEASHAMELDWRLKAKEIKSWEHHKTLTLFSYNEPLKQRYEIDFVVYNKDGSIDLVEVKGAETFLWRLKWNILEKCVDKPAFRKENGFPARKKINLIIVK